VFQGANVVVAFDDYVYDSLTFVKAYRQGTDTTVQVKPSYHNGLGVRSIVIDPKKGLRLGVAYNVQIAEDVSDGANTMRAPVSWSFKTTK
jgi:hypothetical protein